MLGARTIHTPSRSLPAVKAVLREWRALTGPGRDRDCDRSTLVACSGGADSTALVLALATAGLTAGRIVIGHVVHDLRPLAQTLAEREAVATLARELEIPMVCVSIEVRAQAGNTEANARTARYAALDRQALDTGCRFIATAHHRDDQLETMLMRLVRGAGLRGLAGMPRTRPMADSPITLIRPMLSIGRDQAESICRASGWDWCCDATNDDTTRLRAALRHGPLDQLRRIVPRGAIVAGRTARLLADAAGLVEDQAAVLRAQAHEHLDSHGRLDALTWDRPPLRAYRVIVLGELLRAAASELTGGTGADQRSANLVWRTAEAIREQTTIDRCFMWTGLVVRITASRVEMRKVTDNG